MSRPAGPDNSRGVRGATPRGPSGLPSSRARFDARAARVRRRPWLLSALIAVVLAVVAGGVWLVEVSPVLVARTVRVEGVPERDVAGIVGRAAVPMGTPLAKVDTLAIARRVILTASLAEVTVSRSWPSTVLIAAIPRVPVLAVKNPQGQVKVVDSQGVAYATVARPPNGVPLIDTVEDPSSLESMRAAMTVLRALSAGQRDKVTRVTVVGPNMVTLKLGGVTVVWGGESEPDLKVKVMTALLRQKGVATIDVSAPRTPVIR
ncbi:MAG: cell division protein FtsQ [Dermatophilaceae bacterium]|nr:cell division protein FtsQ [Dermatophilaceae bacterium]